MEQSVQLNSDNWLRRRASRLWKCYALGLLSLLLGFQSFAQTTVSATTVSGRVTLATDQTALPGVSVLVKGTSNGTATDANGRYSIAVSDGSTLVFSFIGLVSQEVAVGNQTVIDLAMTEDKHQLSEVVVTALGIEKDKRSIGYAVQKVDGENLTIARETNVVNQLAGKVAGVTVVGSPSGVGGSSRVSIRGERSLNINKNQPLFVIDGVPINNETSNQGGRNNTEVDFGNGAGFVNPDDIASISVLKGANAAALYGSRANNGVILITTKSGKGTKGIGVSVNSNTTFETPLLLPDYQNVYGQGNGNGGDFSFVNGAGAGLTDGTDESWGPKLDQGQLYPQFDSPRSIPGYRGGDLNAPTGSTITSTPWKSYPDNIKNFFETGHTYTNNVAVAGSNEHGDFRLSYTNLDQKGIVPNTDLRRNTFSFSGGYKLNKKFSAKAFVSYIKSGSDNRPSISYGTENIMYLLNCWLPRSVDMAAMKDYWMPGLEGRQQFNFNYNYHDNPYFTLYENTNSQYVDRIIGNISLNYEFTDWLSLQLRTGTDYGNELREYRRAFSSQRFPFGQYRENKYLSEERNTDFLLTAKKRINQDLAFVISAGGNQRIQRTDNLEVVAPQLNAPEVYNLTNSRVALQSAQYKAKRKINSLYGTGQLSFREYLFLDVTARNDWSSTLPAANRSYFYPSAALSAVLSDMFKVAESSPLSYAKLRFGVAQVGNDTDPYGLTQPYNPSDPFGTSPVYSESSTLVNPNLKPEISTSFEVGTELRFLNDRIGLDVTYYQTNSKNQILSLKLSPTTGFDGRFLNAGKITNEGVEVMLNLVPIEIGTTFKWDVNVNFSSNRSKVIELDGNLKNFVIAERRVSIEARVGERMGDMYGIGFARVQNTDPNGKYYEASGTNVGQIVYKDGRPVPTTDRIKLGNYNPDWMAGITNSFTYKGINLSVLFDMRHGGKLYSETQTVGREGGIISETLEGRADGYDLTKPGNGVIGQGVKQNTDGTFQANDVKLTARAWHTAYTNGRGLAEGVMYDASFIKLREVQLGYTIPNKVFTRLPFRNVRISAVGRNLAVWSKVPHVDPEAMSYSGGTALPGIEYMSIPSSRSMGFNISFQF